MNEARRKVVASWLRRPPSSMASTASLQRRVWRSSGYLCFFARPGVLDCSSGIVACSVAGFTGPSER